MNDALNKIDLYGKKWVKTNIRKSCTGSFCPPHWYLEINKGRVGSLANDTDKDEEDWFYNTWGFYPKDTNFYFGGEGEVQHPDLSSTGRRFFAELWVDDCCVDKEAFEKKVEEDANASQFTPRRYWLGFSDCRHYVDDLVKKALADTVRNIWYCKLGVLSKFGDNAEWQLPSGPGRADDM